MTALADNATVAPRRDRSWKRWRNSSLFAVIGALGLWRLGFGAPEGTDATFAIDPDSALPLIVVPGRVTAIGLCVIALGLAAYAAYAAFKHVRTGWWLPAVYTATMLLALLTWAGAVRPGSSIQLAGLFTGAIVLAVPIIFGSLAGVVCERSGVINIAIEGQLLFGAFLSAAVAAWVGNVWFGPYVALAAAPVAGALVGVLLAIFAVKYAVDQIVVGVVLNVLVIGLTSFFFKAASGAASQVATVPDPLDVAEAQAGTTGAAELSQIAIPGLSQIPFLGPVLFNHTILVYLLAIIVVALNIMLFKSRWGLRLRSVGEHPRAADTVGIKVNRTRMRNVVLGGAIAGLGGAAFTIGAPLAFGIQITSGKGFIALAAMILGRWHPIGALAAGLLFGFSLALSHQFISMSVPLPSHFLTMLPYLVTLFAVAGLFGRAKPPAADGQHYKK